MSRWATRLTRMRGPIVAVAGVGAVLSGLVGYYTTYRTVAGAGAPVQATEPVALKPLPTIEADPSIAILPLANLSADKDQEYFSDGLTEEIQNLLAKVPRLRVIARTSSFSFKGSKEPVDAIARKLNVAAVLEGSVRRAGDRVRVKVQLIRTADSSQLWGESFDRPMGDIFQVQDEIAAAVAQRMKGVLESAAPKSQPADSAAYQLSLQAAAQAMRNSPAGRARAVDLYQQALRIDPREPRARTGLAWVYIRQGNTSGRPLSQGYALAREAALQQLALYPGDAMAHALLAAVALGSGGDLRAATQELTKALASPDRPVFVLTQAAQLLASLGRVDEALATLEQLREVDPANPSVHFLVGRMRYIKRDWDGAIAAFQTMLALSPETTNAHYRIGAALLGKGDAASALEEMKKEPSASWRLEGLALAAHAMGVRQASDDALAALVKDHERDSAVNIAGIHAFRGEADAAFHWLGKAVEYKDGLAAINNSPLFDLIRGDKRWLPFLRSIGKAPEQLAAIPFKVPPAK